MSTKIILVEPRLAVASPKPKQAKPGDPSSDQLLMGASGLLLLLLIGLAVFTKLRLDDLSKKLKFEEFRNRELQKKYKMALETMTKMEKANINLIRFTLETITNLIPTHLQMA